MKIKIILILANVILVNVAFLLSFFARYGSKFPRRSFTPYKSSFVFLTLIFITMLAFFEVYKKRFASSWDLFRRVFLGLFIGTLLSIAFVYVFRIRWKGFPTSVFILYFLISLLLIFKVNQFILKAARRIRKQVIILGGGEVDDIVGRKANVERKQIGEINDLLEYSSVDEIVISEMITHAEDLSLLLYLEKKLKAEISFSPLIYMNLLQEKINGNASPRLLGTFVGRRSDFDEFLMRMLDIVVSLVIFIVFWPVMLLVSLLVKVTSHGSVFYKQQRVGKDGKMFTLYKFRTMVEDAEKEIGPVWAKQNDPRITKVGRFLRRTRIDELPQLFNVLRGQMSFVGPRPERPHFVKLHKTLQGLRLAVKPGLTGLAQIRNIYDLHPKHKIKYDFLYIQKRSFWLNVYIILLTVPTVFSKKGW